MNDDYARRQSERDADYEKQYLEWIESLPPEERAALQKDGLDQPAVQRHGSGSANGDAADSPLMSEGKDPALEPEPDPEPPPVSFDAEMVHQSIRRVVAEILYHDNARLTTECIALVSGLVYSGDSMTEIARRHGVTRAAVSKRCVEITELLDLPPSRAMRSLTARQRYRDARIRTTRSHERRRQSP